jgi:CysZ protein
MSESSMIDDAIAAFMQIFTPPFRRTLVKSLALTTGLLAVAGMALDSLALSLVHIDAPWLATAFSVLLGLGLIVGLAFLLAPVTSLVASLFLDEIAERVENEIDPASPPGRAAPVAVAALFGVRFALLSIAVNLFALILLFVPGVNLVAFIGANGYLLGREYFELAAMRFRSSAEARAMRQHFGLTVFLAGLIIAAFVAIPLLNLFTPLFATALMVRLHKRLSAGKALRPTEQNAGNRRQTPV